MRGAPTYPKIRRTSLLQGARPRRSRSRRQTEGAIGLAVLTRAIRLLVTVFAKNRDRANGNLTRGTRSPCWRRRAPGSVLAPVQRVGPAVAGSSGTGAPLGSADPVVNAATAGPDRDSSVAQPESGAGSSRRNPSPDKGTPERAESPSGIRANSPRELRLTRTLRRQRIPSRGRGPGPSAAGAARPWPPTRPEPPCRSASERM